LHFGWADRWNKVYIQKNGILDENQLSSYRVWFPGRSWDVELDCGIILGRVVGGVCRLETGLIDPFRLWGVLFLGKGVEFEKIVDLLSFQSSISGCLSLSNILIWGNIGLDFLRGSL
jgi:hypothetical protein